jgi:type I restriction enzyme S subunit
MRLNQVMNQIRGLSYDKKDVSNNQVNGSIPVLRAGNIQDTRIIYDDLVFVPKEIIKEKQFLRYGDILIAASSGSISIVGKAAMFRENFEITFGAFCKVLRPDKSKIDFEYFKHFFETDYYKRTIKSLAEGANINNLKTEHFDELEIPLPPLEQQKKIAAILDAADANRQLTKALIAKYDELTQSLFLDMFGDPVKNEKGWEVKELGSLLEITSSKRIFKDEYVENGVPFYRTKEIVELSKGNKISLELYISEKRYNEIKQKFEIPEIGDILMSAVGTIGVMWTVDTQKPFYFKDGNLVWLKSSKLKDVNSTYLKMTLNYLIQHEKEKLAEGGAYNALTIAKLNLLKVLIAPVDIQNQFAERVQAIETQKAQAQASLEKAEELFNSLLQRAFNGELV